MQKTTTTWQQLWCGRRVVSERRRFFYSACIPERREIKDRRNGFERRDLLHRPPDGRDEVCLPA
jgi:hypothetical protein